MNNLNFYQGQTNKLVLDNVEEGAEIKHIRESISQMFNMKNVCFLFGSGTSANAIPTMAGLFKLVKERIASKNSDALTSEFETIVKGCGSNLEDILGVLYSHRAYLLIQVAETQPFNLDYGVEYDTCIGLIEIIESTIFNEININFTEQKSQDALELYEEFYRKIALRNKDLSRISVFTTNNDLFNEVALDRLNIHYLNGFGGGVNKFFNPAIFNYTFSKRMDTSIDKFEPVENMVYLYKLHGSINWIEDDSNSNTFFKIKEIGNPERQEGKNILIYPTPTKQNKSLGSPYVELFREFQKKLLDPNTVLFVIGYSFSDEHVNNIIYQALATNSTINIVIINEIVGKTISQIDDNRVFRLWGEIENAEGPDWPSEKIHFFQFIVKNLLPNIDAFRSKDQSIENFISFYNESVRKWS